MQKLILASGSPRRATLLEQLGLSFEVIRPVVDETRHPDETPQTYIKRMSDTKFESVTSTNCLSDEDVVISADTVVVLGGKVLGKPSDRDDCLEMLLSLSGNSHSVLTNVTLGRMTGPPITFCVETIVRFRRLNLNECNAYWQTGEPCDKAGGYGIQGKGAIFVESITGSYSNVVGLPLMETADALAAFGVSPLMAV